MALKGLQHFLPKFADKIFRDIVKRNGIPKFQRGKFVYIP